MTDMPQPAPTPTTEIARLGDLGDRADEASRRFTVEAYLADTAASSARYERASRRAFKVSDLAYRARFALVRGAAS